MWVLGAHALRQEIGADAFDALMDDFGRQNAGKSVTTEQFFQALGEKWPGAAKAFFARQWLSQTGLPNLGKGPAAGPFALGSFHDELEQTLIVYGTGAEANVNKEAAEALQQAIIQRHSNLTVPVKADKDVTDAEAKGRHLLLIGRPDCNSWTARCKGQLPVTFGTRSFKAGGDDYAHAQSAVAVVGENPLDKRYSVVVIAGLSPAATLKAAPQLLASHHPAEIVVYAPGGGIRSLITPTAALSWGDRRGASASSAYAR